MGVYTARNGVDFSYEDWGSGQPVVPGRGTT
jgi:hypothetical protein